MKLHPCMRNVNYITNEEFFIHPLTNVEKTLLETTGVLYKYI